MTVAATPPARAPRHLASRSQTRPQLAPGLEFLGEYQGSGSLEAPYLMRRADGRMLSVSRLLYLLAAEIDGQRDLACIASRLTARLGRNVAPDDVGFLLEQKLAPLGVVAERDGSRARSAPALGLRLPGTVLPEPVVGVAAKALSHLFRPPVVVAAVSALCAFDAWLFFGDGPGRGLDAAVSDPGVAVPILAVILMSAAFHELGHAAAAHYGGARPGRIGIGLYLIWPAFFSDMTDSYRLTRAGRLRTDLGGVYFNGLFILACAAVYWATGFTAILAVIVLQHVLVAYQFLPFLRLDGYYIVSDLVGVPDLFSRIRPVLRSLVPGQPRSAAVQELRPGARFVVTAWVLVTIPLLAGAAALLIVHAPDVAHGVRVAAVREVAHLGAAVGQADLALGLLAALQLAVVAIVPVGLALVILRLLRRALSYLWPSHEVRDSRRDAPPGPSRVAADPGCPDRQPPRSRGLGRAAVFVAVAALVLLGLSTSRPGGSMARGPSAPQDHGRLLRCRRRGLPLRM